MNRRNFFKLAIGAASAAVVLPEAKPVEAKPTPDPQPKWMGCDPVSSDIFCERSRAPFGLDVYSASGEYKGIYRI